MTSQVDFNNNIYVKYYGINSTKISCDALATLKISCDEDDDGFTHLDYVP